jgi:hypothetical protein
MTPAVLTYISLALGLVPTLVTIGGDVVGYIATIKADIAAFAGGTEPTAAQWATLVAQVNAANEKVQTQAPA